MYMYIGVCFCPYCFIEVRFDCVRINIQYIDRTPNDQFPGLCTVLLANGSLKQIHVIQLKTTECRQITIYNNKSIK